MRENPIGLMAEEGLSEMKKKHSPEQTVAKLREAHVALGKG
jgi:hypothetical protein